MPAADGNRRLISVDEAAADYEADVTVDVICASHQLPLTRLYRILDRHQIPIAATVSGHGAAVAGRP